MGKRREAKRNRCHTVARSRSGVACCKISHLWERGLAWMQDWRTTRPLVHVPPPGMRPSTAAQAGDRPSTGLALLRTQRHGRAGELMPACRMNATLVVA